MTRPWLVLMVALAGGGAACVGLTVSDADGCAEACARAAECGFLPSALGFSADDSPALAVADCERRCGNSPRSDATAQAILTCLQGQESTGSWCADPGSDLHALGQTCAGAVDCFDDIAREHELLGRASLSVAMVSFAVFEAEFSGGSGEEPLSIADIYAERAVSAGAVTSCRRALCSRSDCDLTAEERQCDDRTCRRPLPSSPWVCDDLGIEQLVLQARQPGAMPVRRVLFDADDGTQSKCGASLSGELRAEDYDLSPGPVELAVQISGALPAATLATIGYPDAAALAADEPAASMRYCLTFSGPSMLLRAGGNAAVVPVDDLEEWVARGLDSSSLDVCPY